MHTLNAKLHNYNLILNIAMPVCFAGIHIMFITIQYVRENLMFNYTYFS